MQMGLSFIGIETSSRYFDIACRRIEEAQRQGDMFMPTGSTNVVERGRSQSDLFQSNAASGDQRHVVTT